MLLAWRVSSARNLPGASSDFAKFPMLRHRQSVLTVKEHSYAGAKPPNFWEGCKVRCLMSLPNASLSQCHQGGLAISSLSCSVVAKADETKLTFLPVLIKTVLAVQT